MEKLRKVKRSAQRRSGCRLRTQRKLLPALLMTMACLASFAQSGQAEGAPPPSPAGIREASAEFDWYKTQFGTGLGNCGPASAAMAAYWSTGRDVSVEDVREDIGEPNNSRAVSPDHLQAVLDAMGVPSRYVQLDSIGDMYAVIDSGGIAVLWIHTGWLTHAEGDTASTRIGRYYEDKCGHYVVLKGYTLDDRYFIVHDPIPGDWYTNEKLYPDGTMLGRDRYYAVEELWKSLKAQNVIVVERTGERPETRSTGAGG